ncbi:hypothetical protein D8B26_007974 [Coccidioides posadasii str. Silveira]|uniref:uncharacterized protein n=1 Tax=Coccidioides posadasii (strain RMSCC 757 / Silveira) TaxID=443226 RepID=UPI001BEFEB76|nr:hypothetical protein D8B26_007974 [Coccidioides posadasii str. Silveira]
MDCYCQRASEESHDPIESQTNVNSIRPAIRFSHIHTRTDEHLEAGASQTVSCTKNSKSGWPAGLRSFCQEQFNRSIVHPDRILNVISKGPLRAEETKRLADLLVVAKAAGQSSQG